MNAAIRGTKGKPVRVEFREVSGPTPERLLKTDGFYVVGDDQQGAKIITIRDTTLDRMFNRNVLSGAEYGAMQKYRMHWHYAGLEDSIGSLDLDRVFSSDPSSMSGMAKTERQAHHRRQYREARAMLGHRPGIVVDCVVCAEHSLHVAGYAIGWTNKPQAIAAATEMMRDAGYRLARLWGIG